MSWHGLDSIGAAEKSSMRDRILRGPPWSSDEREAVLYYCESDVLALAKLLPAMTSDISLPHALLRGRYMKAISHMEHTGVPVDVEILGRLRAGWERIQGQLVREVGHSRSY